MYITFVLGHQNRTSIHQIPTKQSQITYPWLRFAFVLQGERFVSNVVGLAGPKFHCSYAGETRGGSGLVMFNSKRPRIQTSKNCRNRPKVNCRNTVIHRVFFQFETAPALLWSSYLVSLTVATMMAGDHSKWDNGKFPFTPRKRSCIPVCFKVLIHSHA